MGWRGSICAAALIGVVLCVRALPMSLAEAAPEAVPELRVKIFSDRSEYKIGAKINAKLALVNSSNKTLCFPVPSLKCSDTRTGSLLIKGEPLAGTEEEFICHLCGGSWGTRKDLVESIKSSWIRLAPGQSYQTESVEAQMNFDVLGEWRLTALYRPPEAAFGDFAKFKQYLQAGASEAGCVVPEIAVSSEPVIVNVVGNSRNR